MASNNRIKAKHQKQIDAFIEYERKRQRSGGYIPITSTALDGLWRLRNREQKI